MLNFDKFYNQNPHKIFEKKAIIGQFDIKCLRNKEEIKDRTIYWYVSTNFAFYYKILKSSDILNRTKDFLFY